MVNTLLNGVIDTASKVTDTFVGRRADVGRVCTRVLKDGGNIVNLTGKVVTITYLKPDNTKVMTTCTVANPTQGLITFGITSQVMAVVGNVKCEVKVTNGLAFPIFNINVLEIITDGTALESEDEFTVLQDVIGDVEEAITDMHNNSLMVDITKPPYNAPNNGTDVTSIINQAIIDASTAGKIVYIPPGQYGITQLLLKNNARICGAGRSKTVLLHTGTGTTSKAIVNKNVGQSIAYVDISDLTLDLNVNSTVGIEYARVFQSTLNRVNIVYFDDATVLTGCVGFLFTEGSAPNTSYYNSFYDLSVNGKIGTGYKFMDNANSNRLVNCRTNACVTAVNAATYCDHVVITGCAFEEFTTGVILGGIGCQVTNNRFENSAPGGLAISIISPYAYQDHTILGNAFLSEFNFPYIQNINAPTHEYPLGNNVIADNGTLSAKWIQLENTSDPDQGGWRSHQNLRGWGLKQTGFLELEERTTNAGDVEGRLHYADGVSWNPGSGNGLYFHDGATHRRIGYLRPVPTTYTSYGLPGDYAISDTHYYVCKANGQWKRIPVQSSW